LGFGDEDLSSPLKIGGGMQSPIGPASSNMADAVRGTFWHLRGQPSGSAAEGMMSAFTRNCPQCGVEKSTSDFSAKTPQCKQCKKHLNAAYQQAHRAGYGTEFTKLKDNNPVEFCVLMARFETEAPSKGTGISRASFPWARFFQEFRSTSGTQSEYDFEYLTRTSYCNLKFDQKK
jgi:hypothetical protein